MEPISMEQEQIQSREADRTDFPYIKENLEAVLRNIRAAEREAGRPEGDVRLLAAVKSADTAEINYLTQTLGVKYIGENRVQQLLSRYDALEKGGVEIHFIGSLQKNKVKYIIDKVAAIHSVDSLSLAQEIDKRAGAIGKRMDVYIEINIGREENKGGVLPEDAPQLCRSVAELPNLRVVGLMTMAPHVSDPEAYRAYFSKTRILADRIFREILLCDAPPVLSMGMSESYREAALEGASIVRVGRQLFRKPE